MSLISDSDYFDMDASFNSVVNQLYKMGTIMSVRKVDETMPPIIVQPKGDHKLVAERVSGSSPKMVVVVVRMIGTKRVAAPFLMASNFDFPSAISWFE